MSLEGKVVFVLEDDAFNLAVITGILKRKGCKVYTDIWGTSTLAQLKQIQHIDLILLDLMLDRTSMSGYAIYDQIRGEPTLKEVPVVLVTAADPDIEGKIASDKGFNGFISKPLDHRVFPEQIEEILDGKKVWAVR